MEYKILYGSKLLRLNNPRDEDWVIYFDEDLTNTYVDIKFYTRIINLFVEGKTRPDDTPRALNLYQRSKGFHNHPDYPFSFFNILDHKGVWTQMLKNNINQVFHDEHLSDKEILPKTYYHMQYQYHMIKENTHWISEEGLAIVQKIHDLEMPASYFYELRDLINSLPEE